MKQRLQSALCLAAGLVAAVSATLLTVDYLVALRRAPADEARLKSLERLVKEEPAREAELLSERDRQTRASLKREARAGLQGRLLLAGGIVFLVFAKRWTARRPAPFVFISKEELLRSAQRLHSWPAAGQATGARADGGPHTTASSRPRFEIELASIGPLLEQIGRGREAVIPVLQAIQSQYGYLPAASLERVCEESEITPAQITGVASFYRHFRQTPAGRHIVRVCNGTACHVAGADRVHDEIHRHLGIAEGCDTDPGREFTVEKVACMGCCTLAPVMQVGTVTRGHVAIDEIPGILQDCLSADEAGNSTAPLNGSRVAAGHEQSARAEIRVGVGSCCVAGGSGKVYQALEQAVAAAGGGITVKPVGCVGMCHRTPLVEAVVHTAETARYARVRPEEAVRIIRRHLRPRSAWSRMARRLNGAALGLRRNGTAARSLGEIAFTDRDPPVAAFLDRQKHVATEHCGQLNPTDFDEYVRHGGFEGFRRCVLSVQPERVIEQIKASGLRGRGGAGFPAAVKWSRVREAAGEVKYVICNGDEGDPGAFMDRMLMESFPFRILEGMAIAAFAVGATEGYFYIRAEYPLAVRRIKDALRECRRRGLLGERILGTGFSLNVRVMEGAGAFVCGEETALIASIEGDRGTPRLRPPFPADKGLFGSPTLINNVETYANVPWIIRNGPAAFALLGTATSKGTKVFALAGKVRRGGLIEVPMGITIREIVEEIGGGAKEGKRFKAVQIGGPSGGCIPAELADLPVDYETLASAGAIMGSGGLVVLDESDCMVDMARYFLSFTQDQSCGKCTFCRVGTRRMLDILERICEGKGRPGDLEELEQLADHVKKGSLCGLGKTAPNPVLTTLRYFRSEYESHLQGHCPARTCKRLIRYRVLDNCTGCTRCAQYCGDGAIAFAPYQKHRVDDAKCTRCGVCVTKCPEHAIVVESPCPG